MHSGDAHEGLKEPGPGIDPGSPRESAQVSEGHDGRAPPDRSHILGSRMSLEVS